MRLYKLSIIALLPLSIAACKSQPENADCETLIF